VLVAARTLTSTYRLLEALDLFRGDFRIRFVFAVNDTSAFSQGVHEVLQRAGARVVSWATVARGAVPHDLVLSASENIDFRQVDAHTVVLPHGIGFNKYVPERSGDGMRLAGLPPEWVLRAGRATVVLSHPEQQDQLRAVSPASAGRTAVVGDLGFDRIRASHDLRDRFRDDLGAHGRTLVMLSSTWRQDSLLGRWHTIPLQLLGELPADNYQVCAVLHPNIWSFYGSHQVSLWLAEAVDAGLMLLPPEEGWQAALIAADVVITDHGSMGLMAAALDTPVLLNEPSGETVPGTPPDSLARAAMPLRTDTPLREQIDQVRETHRPGRFAEITSRVFARSGLAATNLRALIYGLLGLAPLQQEPGLRRIPPISVRRPPVTSHVVLTVPALDVLVLTRFPAPAWRDEYAADAHLVAEDVEQDLKILERAAAITHVGAQTEAKAAAWARSVLTVRPGARIAISATPTGALALLRTGELIEVGFAAQDGPVVALAASAIYCCLLSGTTEDRTLTVHAGTTSVELTLRFRPAEAGAAGR
jgi:hypothetical protein